MKYNSIFILLLLTNLISCENNESRINNLIARGEKEIRCFGKQSFLNFSFILSTNVINISALGSSSNYDASVYSEDGEILSIYYANSVYDRAKEPLSDGIFAKFIYNHLHTIECKDPYGCLLYSSPFKRTCVSIKSNIDANYQIIVRRNLKLSTILNLFIGLILIHYAPTISQYKLYYYISFTGLGTLFSLFFILYYILHRYTKGASGFFLGVIASIGFATNKWLPFLTSFAQDHPYLVVAYFTIALIVSICCTLYFSSYFNPDSKLGYVVKWLIRDIGLFIIYYSIPSVRYGLIITGCVFIYCNIVDVLPKKLVEKMKNKNEDEDDDKDKEKNVVHKKDDESDDDDENDLDKTIDEGMRDTIEGLNKIDPDEIDFATVDKKMVVEALNTMNVGLRKMYKAITPRNSKNEEEDE